MKKFFVLPALLLVLLGTGCISVLPEPPTALARYDVPLPNSASATGATEEAESAGVASAAAAPVIVVGRVRAAEEAAGRSIRTSDTETGRTGVLVDGELARTPEAIVGAFLRARLAALHPGAVVCDAAIAPRTGKRTTVEAWIERFRLEKTDGAWTFVASMRFFTTDPDGTVTVAEAAPSIPVETSASRPTTPEAVAAIAKALASIELPAEIPAP